MDIVHFMRIVSSFGYDVAFLPSADMAFDPRYSKDLEEDGISCPCKPHYNSVEQFIRQHGSEFDVIFLYRCSVADRFIDLIKETSPKTRVIFDTVDLHFVREEREAILLRSTEGLASARRTRAAEFKVIRQADCTIVLSATELVLVEKFLPEASVQLIPIVREIPGRSAGYDERSGVLFVGGFAHKPNVDGIFWFVESVWPLVRAQRSDIKLTIVGSNATPEIFALASVDRGIFVKGFVDDLSAELETCRASVAPLRYGAGIKGKVVSSLAHGVPVVATAIATEGMGLNSRDGVLVGATASELASAVIRIHTDAEEWTAMSDAGINFAGRNFSLAEGRVLLNRLFLRLGLPLHEAAANASSLPG